MKRQPRIFQYTILFHWNSNSTRQLFVARVEKSWSLVSRWEERENRNIVIDLRNFFLYWISFMDLFLSSFIFFHFYYSNLQLFSMAAAFTYKRHRSCHEIQEKERRTFTANSTSLQSLARLVGCRVTRYAHLSFLIWVFVRWAWSSHSLVHSLIVSVRSFHHSALALNILDDVKRNTNNQHDHKLSPQRMALRDISSFNIQISKASTKLAQNRHDLAVENFLRSCLKFLIFFCLVVYSLFFVVHFSSLLETRQQNLTRISRLNHRET